MEYRLPPDEHTAQVVIPHPTDSGHPALTVRITRQMYGVVIHPVEGNARHEQTVYWEVIAPERDRTRPPPHPLARPRTRPPRLAGRSLPQGPAGPT